jgi:hypothetical protein
MTAEQDVNYEQYRNRWKLKNSIFLFVLMLFLTYVAVMNNIWLPGDMIVIIFTIIVAILWIAVIKKHYGDN